MDQTVDRGYSFSFRMEEVYDDIDWISVESEVYKGGQSTGHIFVEPGDIADALYTFIEMEFREEESLTDTEEARMVSEYYLFLEKHYPIEYSRLTEEIPPEFL